YSQVEKCRISMEGLAECLEMDRSTLYRRLTKGGINFTLAEIRNLIKILALTKKDILEIFFAE
ncbi:MAG: hypothetical protein RSE10_08840, partial [Oscillospiraceae bacterium]